MRRRREVSKRDMIQGLLLLIAFMALLSFAGASDMESRQAVTKELALFHVAGR